MTHDPVMKSYSKTSLVLFKKVVEKISVSIPMNLSKSAMQILTAFCFTAIEKTSPNRPQKIPL